MQEGDQLVLVATINRNSTIATPAGWDLIGTEQAGRPGRAPDMTSAVFTTVADAGSAGSTVVTPLGSRSKTSLTLVAYTGSLPTVTAVAATRPSSSNSMTTPEVAVVQDDTVVLSYWVDKTGGNTGWTLPVDVTSRAISNGSGGGRITAAIADREFDAGTAAGATATSSVSGSKAIGWTITLAPAIVNEAPTATFAVDCTNLVCTFDAAGSFEPNGTIVSYDWDFGDGTTATGVDQTHTFTTADTFDVTLTVTDDDTQTDDYTQSVVTTFPPNEAPTAAFTVDCTDLSCDFNAAGSTDADGTIASYDWDFGDGATATGVNPTHIYAATGDYTVELTVTDDDDATGSSESTANAVANEAPTATFAVDCTNLVCTFDAAGSFEPNGTIVSYDWDFGDGTTATGVDQTHTFTTADTFDVTLTVTDDDTQTDDYTQSVVTTFPPNEAPTAAFTVDCTGTSCTFDGSTSFEPNGTIVSYDWDFGDGATDTGVNPTHVYAANGSYDVTLTVTDDDTETGFITTGISTNFAPVAAFTVDCTDLGCTFDATDSDDSDGTIVSYDWTFGDDTTGTGDSPTHDYAAGGTYDVELTVTDDAGATDTVTVQASPTWPNAAPVALFTTTCVDLRCTFDAIDANEPNGTIVRYDWDFGDGNTAADGGLEIVHNYLFDGTFDVELTVTDDDGETATLETSAVATFPTPLPNVLPPDVPRRDVPIISSGEITDLEYIGDRVYIVGSFSSIRNNVGGNNNTVNQRFVAAYDINTGLVDTTFRPTFDRSVTEITRSPDGNTLYVVGRFNSVNGITRRKIAAIDPITGATITAFSANANSAATAVAATNDTVYVGGQFSKVRNTDKVGLVALDAQTGQLVNSFDNDMSGGIGVNGLLTVQAMDISPDLSTLLVVHTGRQIAGQDRYGIGLIDTNTNQLMPWRTRLWDDNLARVGGLQRIYAGAISPDGEWFVVSSGSGGDRPPISDTAVAYRITAENGSPLGDFVEPMWISRLFDSVYSVDISDDAVFIGGHFNYAESQTAPDPWPGLDTVGYGRGQGLAGYGLGDDIVIRYQIAALDPSNGKALEWNPGTNAFEGNKAMLVHPRGLITGGDGNIQGGYNVGRVAFYDFDSVGSPGQNETKILYPIEGRVEKTNVEFVIGGTATATSGVSRVQLEVISNNRWLQDDLTTFGNWNAINVILENPGATSTNWALPLTIEDSRELKLLARTYANNGSNDSTKDIQRIETFGLSDETPTTRITEPRRGTIVPTLDFTAAGTATDDLGVVSIRISLRDAQNRYLQDDGSVDDLYNSFTTQPDVIGAINATWSYEFEVPFESEWTMVATAVDSSGQPDLRGVSQTFLVSEVAERPAVAMTSPVVVNPPFDETIIVAPGSPFTISGLATDDEGLRDVEIRLRNSTTDENLASDGTWSTNVSRGYYRISPVNISGTSYNWSYTTPFNLTQGTYDFDVYATDDLGLRTSSTLRVDLNVVVQIPGDNPPDARADVTGNVSDFEALHIDATGTATDDIGISEVLVELRDLDTGLYLQPDGTAGGARVKVPATVTPNPDATSVTWSVSLDLPTEGEWYLQAFAYDTSGQVDTSQSGAQTRYYVYPGDEPPAITLLSPPNGTTFNDARIIVSGRVEDDRQIASARVAIQNSDGYYMSSSGTFTSTNINWRTAFLNSPGSPGSNFSYTTPAIPSGDYTVYVIGVDSHGFSTEIPGEIEVVVTSPPNDPPVAAFTYSCTDNVCDFDGLSSTDEDAVTLTYSWNFGNGSGSGPLPSRTYTSAGIYPVTLTVRDFYGLTAEITQEITIEAPAGNSAPIPVLSAPSCSLLTCNFSSLGTADPDAGDSYSVAWDFGDGTTSGSTYPSHTFPGVGQYTVTLTATDGWGAFSSVDVLVDIQLPPGNVAPTPVIDTPVCTLLSCDFTSINSFDANAGDTFTVAWDFGDLGTSTSTSPTHAYAAPGTYTVTLTVTDVWGAADVTDVSVTVSDI